MSGTSSFAVVLFGTGLRRGLVFGEEVASIVGRIYISGATPKRELATTGYRDGLDVRLPSFMER
jgi:hypothetical protein